LEKSLILELKYSILFRVGIDLLLEVADIGLALLPALACALAIAYQTVTGRGE
jgi:hypothetical protein